MVAESEHTRVERAVGALVALLVILAVAGVAVGAVAGADQLAVITPSPHSVDAESGEEFTVDITMVTDGGHGGEGVESVDLVAQYHPEYLEITAIEPGPWLEQDEETEVHEEEILAHSDGTAILEQWRDPVKGGATGNERLATVTVEVADDAPPGAANINFEETSVNLERSYPMPIHDQNVSVTIDDEDEPVESFDHPEPDLDELEGHQNGEQDKSGEDGTDAAEDPDNADDSVPGFDGITLIATAIGSLVAVFLWGRDCE
ncbi:cohesin domain-containing protein [Halostagnicola bangensis]